MAEISLPARSRGSSPRRRPQAAPTSADVPDVRVPSDPGVRMPAIQKSGLEDAGTGLANFGAELARVGDAVERARRKAAIATATTRATADLNSFVLDLENDTDYRTYADRFGERAKSAFETHGEGLDDESKAIFRQNFEKLSVEKAFVVRKLGQKRVADAAEADLDESLDGYARLAATATSDSEREQAVLQGDEAIKSLADVGMISRQEAGKRKRGFLGKIDETDAREMIFADPRAAERALSDPALFPSMDPQRRISMLDTAARRADTQMRQRISDAERIERAAERALKKTQASNEAAAVVRINRAQAGEDGATLPTLQELTDMLDRQEIGEDGFRALEQRLYATDEGRDNPNVVNDLYDRMIRDGSDIHAEILKRRANKQLSGKTADQLIVTNQNRIQAREKEPFRTAEEKRAYDFLSTKLGADKLAFSFDDDTANRLADARREFQQRVFGQNEPALQAADDIVQKYQRVQAPPPEVGYVNMPIRSDEDVTTAGQKLRALKDTGRITEADYRREMTVLRRHSDMLSVNQPQPQPKAK